MFTIVRTPRTAGCHRSIYVSRSVCWYSVFCRRLMMIPAVNRWSGLAFEIIGKPGACVGLCARGCRTATLFHALGVQTVLARNGSEHRASTAQDRHGLRRRQRCQDSRSYIALKCSSSCCILNYLQNDLRGGDSKALRLEPRWYGVCASCMVRLWES